MRLRVPADAGPGRSARSRRRTSRRGAGARPWPRRAAAARRGAHDCDGSEQPGASDHAVLHEHGASERRVEPRRTRVGTQLAVRADRRRRVESAARFVGADAAAPRAENARGARLLHAAESRRAQRERSRLRFGRHARLHVPAIATWSCRPAKTARSTCSTRSRSAAPIIGRRCSRSRRATTSCRTRRWACGARRRRS